MSRNPKTPCPLMVASKLTSGLPSISALRRMRGLVPECARFGTQNYPAGYAFCRKTDAAFGEAGMPPKRLHASQWPRTDNRQSTWTPWYSDFGHKMSTVPTWRKHQHKPACAVMQLAGLDVGMKMPPDESVSTSVEGQCVFKRLGEASLEIGMCRNLCENGRISDAVNALNLLVQQGFHVHNNLFYLVLKRCIAQNDLAMGRHIHSLTIKSGYEGNAFLATHLISLYASHGRLEEAMHVFTKVSVPTVYNWTTIIFAYSRHGEAAQAIRLYRQMLESTTVKPDNRLFVAILKACATAGDLVAGKEVHAHILAVRGRPDIFVQAGLVSMYAKCGSLVDARRVFDSLVERDVVTWTALIAGYTQQGMGEEALKVYRSMQHEGLNPPDCVTYVCLLQACATVGAGAFDQGKQIHAEMEEQGLPEDLVLGGSLVNMYAKCGSLRDARMVFDNLPERTVVTWSALLTGYAQQGMGEEALSLYSRMRQEGLNPPDSVTYLCLLQACASIGVVALDYGKQLHAQIEEQGLQEDLVLGGSLISMYAKCGGLEHARMVFDGLPVRDVVTWTAMIAGYTQLRMGKEALTLYSRMRREGSAAPDSVTYVCLLQACASVGVGALDQGKLLHSEIAERGLNMDLGGSLVNMFANCGSLADAHGVFDRLPERDLVAWNALLAGYAQHGKGEEALSLYSRMQQESLTPDSITYVCLLQACLSVGVGGAMDQGKRLHAQIEEQGLQEDVVLGGSLINMYVKCGSLGDARRVFDRLPERDVVAWNAMIAGLAQHGLGQEALSLYSRMQQESVTPNSVTYVCLLQACASVGVGAGDQGKQLHAQIEEQGLEGDLVVGGSLVNMYAKCGSLGYAHRVFDRLSTRDVVTWNGLLAGYVQLGLGQEALSLYDRMQQEGTPSNAVTYVCLLQACATVGTGAMHQGKQLHAEIEEQELQGDLVLGGSLVNMYAKCGSLGDACRVFARLPEKNVVTWNALFAGYAQHGLGQEAFHLYHQMQQEGLTCPNSVTYVCLLQACACVAALPLVKQLHAQINEAGLEADVAVGAALVNLYAKCGSMFYAQQVFDSLPERSVEEWNALTSGYARLGDSEVVFDSFNRMRLEGIQPDAITFLCLLTVCSHVGQVDKGCKYFEAMKLDYGISPTVEHYTCMMDLLGRGGHLKEALQMAKTMPFPPNGVVWRTLLAACSKWKNVEVGEQAFEFAVTEDGKDAATYVLMSNIYASAKMWEKAKEMQAKRKRYGAWKKAGQSWWTDMGGVVHTFVVGDEKHPESAGIYARLAQLLPKMTKAGYTPQLRSSLRDISDDAKEADLRRHSEKLSIAYALQEF